MAILRLIFLGAPGTGKGTQAGRMSRRFDIPAISSGDVIRQEMKVASEVGRKAAAYVTTGKLVPDEVITEVILSGLRKLPSAGFILDGFPRTVPQALSLEAELSSRRLPIHAVIDFQMADVEIVKRTADRRVCSNCKALYNLQSFPPRSPGVCDQCGGTLEQRPDDDPRVVANRLETYRSLTAPLKAHYAARGLLRSVDASRDADAVEIELAALLASLGER
jgi:adenylate kinase